MSKPTSRQRVERHPHVHHVREESASLTQFFAGYFWFIVKNVIGWIFILGAIPLGVTVPGPGGIPVFLIGFALVTFPGKRRLTSRVMRGRPFDLQTRLFTFLTAAVSVVITASLLWLFIGRDRYEKLQQSYGLQVAHLIGILTLSLVVTWLVTRLGLQLANWLLTRMPVMRRRIRPWLRKKGLRLLPPRRKGSEQLLPGDAAPDENEILVIHERHHRRLWYVWSVVKPWIRRAVIVAITVAIFAWILRPIFLKWNEVRGLIYQTSIPRLGLATGMFAFFLFAFRAMVWRRILQDYGHRLPVAAAVRIWSTSELARYLPGVIWQVVGRVYLVRPYGVRGSVCSVSQILELAVFLLANMLVAVSCLLYFGIKNLEGAARAWLYAASALVPVLLVLLHPKVFYGLINRVMLRLGKPQIVPQSGWLELSEILAWNIIGLLWQSLALYLLLDHALKLKPDWWWVLAGAYCLAWCAGFLAVWAPGGIGVRELVFVTAMHVALPDAVRDSFAQREVLLGFLAFLSVLLRVWTTLGELILATIAYSFDLRGALGFPDAPGRVPIARRTDLDSAA